jgi:hypothetical protein
MLPDISQNPLFCPEIRSLGMRPGLHRNIRRLRPLPHDRQPGPFRFVASGFNLLPLPAEVGCVVYMIHGVAVSVYGNTVLPYFLDPIFNRHENLPESRRK